MMDHVDTVQNIWLNLRLLGFSTHYPLIHNVRRPDFDTGCTYALITTMEELTTSCVK